MIINKVSTGTKSFIGTNGMADVMRHFYYIDLLRLATFGASDFVCGIFLWTNN